MKSFKFGISRPYTYTLIFKAVLISYTEVPSYLSIFYRQKPVIGFNYNNFLIFFIKERLINTSFPIPILIRAFLIAINNPLYASIIIARKGRLFRIIRRKLNRILYIKIESFVLVYSCFLFTFINIFPKRESDGFKELSFLKRRR